MLNIWRRGPSKSLRLNAAIIWPFSTPGYLVDGQSRFSMADSRESLNKMAEQYAHCAVCNDGHAFRATIAVLRADVILFKLC